MGLPSDVLAGSRLALARLLTQVENGVPEGRAALDELFPHTGHAHLVGVTGAPGTGKSSLVNRLALHYRRQAQCRGESCRVAILAVDPSSPFTGGAILGDRVRMRDLSGDSGVFIRSMASRGSLGGLAAATSAMAQVFDAAGYDKVLIETVGAGQSEVDIARLAHTTLVIEAPGLGDDIQAIKAGILEIADVLVINKADRPGLESTERALKGMLQLGHPTHNADWLPPIVQTVATEGQGIDELAAAVDRHYLYLQQTRQLGQRERARLQAELDLLLRDELVARWRNQTPEDAYEQALDKVAAHQLSPYQAVTRLIRNP
ncbi:MAG: methylmalonyl Co-A mutase-associated GTPase MeaB [Chloroflexota bacterium]